MSVCGGKTNIARTSQFGCEWPEADIELVPTGVSNVPQAMPLALSSSLICERPHRAGVRNRESDRSFAIA